MSTEIDSDVPQLIQEGNAALRVGDMHTARLRFRRATELDSQNVAAWLGLAAAVRPYSEKRDAFQRVLALDPTNQEARLGLEYVEAKIANGEIMALPDRRERFYAQIPPTETSQSTPTSDSLTQTTTARPEVEFCYRHPDRETGLHCSLCDRPICAQCAVPGPVGQICPECARERRPSNYKVNARDIIVAGLVAFVVTLPISILLGLFLRGFFAIIILLMLGPGMAELIVRAVERTTNMKRGRTMQVTVGIAIGLACLIAFGLFPNLFVLGIFAFLAISTAVARLR